jgi:30S ribosomal protein S31
LSGHAPAQVPTLSDQKAGGASSMGKGDQRSRRGKIWRGTFGKRRPKKSNSAPPNAVAPAGEEKKSTKKQPATEA